MRPTVSTYVTLFVEPPHTRLCCSAFLFSVLTLFATTAIGAEATDSR
jgi:hypothetical protein